MRENIILMPKFNLELFKNLILNFAYIHSKRRKVGMFVPYQKCQLSKKKQIRQQFADFLHFQFLVMCRVSIVKR